MDVSLKFFKEQNEKQQKEDDNIPSLKMLRKQAESSRERLLPNSKSGPDKSQQDYAKEREQELKRKLTFEDMVEE